MNIPLLARIQAIEIENALTKTLILDATTEATPGQFVMLWLPRLDEKPFSLVEDTPLTVTVVRVGPFTSAVHKLRAGDRLWWRGPFGHGFRVEGRRLLLVGGGCGAAPLAFLARQAVDQGCQVTVALGALSMEKLLLMNRFRSLGVKILIATEDGSAGQQGTVTDLVPTLLDQGMVDTLYGCGPEGMLLALEKLARDYRVPAQLSWEAYMRCGVGLCGSCERAGHLVCRDGPVFRVEFGKSGGETTCQERR